MYLVLVCSVFLFVIIANIHLVMIGYDFSGDKIEIKSPTLHLCNTQVLFSTIKIKIYCCSHGDVGPSPGLFCVYNVLSFIFIVLQYYAFPAAREL